MASLTTLPDHEAFAVESLTESSGDPVTIFQLIIAKNALQREVPEKLNELQTKCEESPQSYYQALAHWSSIAGRFNLILPSSKEIARRTFLSYKGYIPIFNEMPDGVKTTDDILVANEALNNYRKEHIIDIPQHISKEFSDMKNSSMLFVKKNSNATGMKDASTYFGQFATAWSQMEAQYSQFSNILKKMAESKDAKDYLLESDKAKKVATDLANFLEKYGDLSERT